MSPRRGQTTLDEAIETVGDERRQVVGDAWLADELQRDELDAAAEEGEDAAERRRQREEETTEGAQERPTKKKKRPRHRGRPAPAAGADDELPEDADAVAIHLRDRVVSRAAMPLVRTLSTGRRKQWYGVHVFAGGNQSVVCKRARNSFVDTAAVRIAKRKP